jgi:hypothetical protein
MRVPSLHLRREVTGCLGDDLERPHDSVVCQSILLEFFQRAPVNEATRGLNILDDIVKVLLDTLKGIDDLGDDPVLQSRPE